MLRRATRASIVSAALCAWIRASTAGAQSSAGAPQSASAPLEARAAFERGVSLSQQERWGEALEQFRQSFELVPRPSAAFNIATTLVRLGRHVEAVAAFERYLQIADPSAEGSRYADAQAQLQTERGSIATLELSIDPADAELRIDGQRIADGAAASRVRSVDPGTHTIEASAARHRAFMTTVRVRSGERLPVRVRLEPITTATLEVVSSVPSAAVRVDGAPFGEGPQQVQAGAHEIIVSAPGYQSYRRRVTLAPDSALRVDAALSAASTTRPVYQSPAFWAGVGGGAVAIAGAAVLIALLTAPPPEFQTSTGVVIQGLSSGR